MRRKERGRQGLTEEERDRPVHLTFFNVTISLIYIYNTCVYIVGSRRPHLRISFTPGRKLTCMGLRVKGGLQPSTQRERVLY